jgi:thiamine-phosphate pyrophosphorylase
VVDLLDPKMRLPRLYAILDPSFFPGDTASALVQHALELAAGGVALMQYRNKTDTTREMLEQASELRRVLGREVTLIMNDRADLALAAGFDGVHVGQDDLSPESVRRIVGQGFIVGVSTHNPLQVREADQWPVDYIAVGPCYATSSKANPDPVIGPEGVRTARSLTRKPLVAIGGINRGNARAIFDAGANSVAVISDLLRDPRKAAQEFPRIV